MFEVLELFGCVYVINHRDPQPGLLVLYKEIRYITVINTPKLYPWGLIYKICITTNMVQVELGRSRGTVTPFR